MFLIVFLLIQLSINSINICTNCGKVFNARNNLLKNLTDAQKTYLIGRQYEAQKKTVGAPVGNKNRCAQNEHIAKADGERVNRTAQAIAKEHGISREAVKRTEKIDHSPQKVKTAPGVAAPRTVIGGSTLTSLLPSNHNKCRRKKQCQEKKIRAPRRAQAASGSVLTVDGKRA